MRSLNSFALSSFIALTLAACGTTSSSAPDAVVSDRPTDTAPDSTPDATTDVAHDTAPDATVDTAVDVMPDTADEGTPDGPCMLDVSSPDTGGPLHGYIRFVHVGRSMGTARFIARSLPGFAPAYVEAVVREGEATPHILTLPVAYEVRVTPAGDASPGVTVDAALTDAGVLTDGPGSPTAPCNVMPMPGELVPPLCTDVYFVAGCTVVMGGSRAGNERDFTDRRLLRLSDIPARSADCDTGTVRTLSMYALGAPVDVDRVGGTPISRITNFRETSGMRRIPSGPLRVTVRDGETGAALGEFAAGSIAPGHAHTLYVWGDGRRPDAPAPSALLLDDLPPPLW